MSSNLNHPALVESLRKAYSAERAASLAYIGHAASLTHPDEKTEVRNIENDEWEHRRNVLEIMQTYDIPVSTYYEFKYCLIGTFIGFSCHLIGRFMPYFFAGKLESGNVCEYFAMMRQFHELEIVDHDEVLYEMGKTEKEHEVYFQERITDSAWLRLFESVFRWGTHSSHNDVDLSDMRPVAKSGGYCRKDSHSTAASTR